MKQDLRNKISELMEKMDGKITESRIKHALGMLENGNHEDIAKKLANVDKKELQSKLDELSKMNPEDLQVLRDKISKTVNKSDLKSLEDHLDSDGKKLLEKIISTFKLS